MTQERYNIISDSLIQFRRRFTLLDLGGGIDTHISKDISNNFPCVTVVLERDIKDLEGYGPHSMVLKHDITADELERLGECEHFDVVLALNFLHHFPAADWKKAALAVINMGDVVFIQLPNIEELNVPGNDFLPDLWSLIKNVPCSYHVANTVQFPGHPSRPLVVVDNTWRMKLLNRTHIDAHHGSAETLISSDYATILADTKKGLRHDWILGINLWNFCRLGGVLPHRDRILDMLRDFPCPVKNHGDIVPWNFIIDGNMLHLIDGFEGWEFDDRKNLEKTIDMVKELI